MDVIKLHNKDLREAAHLLSRQEVRYLVNYYYDLQEYRKSTKNQVRSLPDEEPGFLLGWVGDTMEITEKATKKTLGFFAEDYSVGQWLQGITGIGDVLSAGLLAFLDIRNAPTAGHWWRLAGLDPRQQWLSREQSKKLVKSVMEDAKKPTLEHLYLCADRLHRKPENWEKVYNDIICKGNPKPLTTDRLISLFCLRPWNQRLKYLCYHAGECFVKTQNNDNDFYGKLYLKKKVEYINRNDNGGFTDLANQSLEKKRYGTATVAYKAYIEGRLPDAHIHAMARRWVIKLFLSHLHHMSHVDYFGVEPPMPYAFTHCAVEHAHYIAPPVIEGCTGKNLKDLLE